jgi:NADH-ubiquinone oxidoreductase chain 6
MVYIGAIAILFLFVVMMLNIRLVELTQIGSEYSKNVPLAVIIASTLSYLILSNATLSKLDNLYLITAIFDKLNEWFLGINVSENYIYTGFNVVYNNIFVNYEQIQSIGAIMYSTYGLYLILASFILLLAMLGPIIITLDRRSNTPTPHLKSDRVQLLVSLLIFSTIDLGTDDYLLSFIPGILLYQELNACGSKISLRGLSDKHSKQSLDPNFITGFTDAEGCFLIKIGKKNSSKLNWQVRATFAINLHSKDLELLRSFQLFFNGIAI